MIAEVNGYAYSLSDDALWVHLYGSNELNTVTADGESLRVTQESNYPWEGKITLTVERPAAAVQALMVRIPGWVKGATVTVNGESIEAIVEPGTYCRIEREWAAGDVVVIDLPLPVRLLQSHPLVEETRNQVAVMRGPVVYCLESPDLPAGARPIAVALTRQSEFTVELMDEGPLAGIAQLAGRGVINENEPTWVGQLYQEIQPVTTQTIPLKLTPYYAWDNRGKSEMTVWMNRATNGW